jgi:hypothetical protein
MVHDQKVDVCVDRFAKGFHASVNRGSYLGNLTVVGNLQAVFSSREVGNVFYLYSSVAKPRNNFQFGAHIWNDFGE